MALLILVRHGESEWNQKGLWTGLTDVPLSQKGREEAARTGKLLLGLPMDIAYTSTLIRAKDTLSIALKELGKDLPTKESAALNERDYGVYTGKNKWEVKETVGDENFTKIRRSYSFPIPSGESLEAVYKRVVPYYESDILPELKKGKNVIVSAHGNSLRALAKFLENISDDDIANLEIRTGEAWVYSIDEKNGAVLSKETRAENPIAV